MNAYLRQFAARCHLGEHLDACTQALGRATPRPASLSFEQLGEPVTMPYFACAETPEDFYQSLGDTLQSLLERAGIDAQGRARTALLVGSSSFDVHVSEDLYRAQLQGPEPDKAVSMPIIGYGKLAERLAENLGLSPLCSTYSTACTSSANALLYAGRMLDQGLADHALVLGVEQHNRTSALGFHGLGLIAPSGEMHPFDDNRDGLILGEGTGAVLLSHGRHTPATERRWQLAGGAVGTDNHSLTAAHVSGEEIVDVMAQALAEAGSNREDIRAVKAHGTASLKNDEAEAAALNTVFHGAPPPAFAFKPYIGHTLGACGALETALALATMNSGRLPYNPHARGDGNLGVKLLREPLPCRPGDYLFNCFAFGGNNNVLVIRDHGESGGAQ